MKQTHLNPHCLCAPQLNELTERNAECVEMLHESQEEIKELRSKNTPSAGMRRHLSYGLYPMVIETHREQTNYIPLKETYMMDVYSLHLLLVCVQDSLAAEIEGTMRRELSVEEETAFQDQRLETQMSLQFPTVGCSCVAYFLTFDLSCLQNIPEASVPDSPLRQCLSITSRAGHTSHPRLRTKFSSDDSTALPVRPGVRHDEYEFLP